MAGEIPSDNSFEQFQTPEVQIDAGMKVSFPTGDGKLTLLKYDLKGGTDSKRGSTDAWELTPGLNSPYFSVEKGSGGRMNVIFKNPQTVDPNKVDKTGRTYNTNEWIYKDGTYVFDANAKKYTIKVENGNVRWLEAPVNSPEKKPNMPLRRGTERGSQASLEEASKRRARDEADLKFWESKLDNFGKEVSTSVTQAGKSAAKRGLFSGVKNLFDNLRSNREVKSDLQALWNLQSAIRDGKSNQEIRNAVDALNSALNTRMDPSFEKRVTQYVSSIPDSPKYTLAIISNKAGNRPEIIFTEKTVAPTIREPVRRTGLQQRGLEDFKEEQARKEREKQNDATQTTPPSREPVRRTGLQQRGLDDFKEEQARKEREKSEATQASVPSREPVRRTGLQQRGLDDWNEEQARKQREKQNDATQTTPPSREPVRRAGLGLREAEKLNEEKDRQQREKHREEAQLAKELDDNEKQFREAGLNAGKGGVDVPKTPKTVPTAKQEKSEQQLYIEQKLAEFNASLEGLRNGVIAGGYSDETPNKLASNLQDLNQKFIVAREANAPLNPAQITNTFNSRIAGDPVAWKLNFDGSFTFVPRSPTPRKEAPQPVKAPKSSPDKPGQTLDQKLQSAKDEYNALTVTLEKLRIAALKTNQPSDVDAFKKACMDAIGMRRDQIQAHVQQGRPSEDRTNDALSTELRNQILDLQSELQWANGLKTEGPKAAPVAPPAGPKAGPAAAPDKPKTEPTKSADKPAGTPGSGPKEDPKTPPSGPAKPGEKPPAPAGGSEAPKDTGNVVERIKTELVLPIVKVLSQSLGNPKWATDLIAWLEGGKNPAAKPGETPEKQKEKAEALALVGKALENIVDSATSSTKLDDLNKSVSEKVNAPSDMKKALGVLASGDEQTKNMLVALSVKLSTKMGKPHRFEMKDEPKSITVVEGKPDATPGSKDKPEIAEKVKNATKEVQAEMEAALKSVSVEGPIDFPAAQKKIDDVIKTVKDRVAKENWSLQEKQDLALSIKDRSETMNKDNASKTNKVPYEFVFSSAGDGTFDLSFMHEKEKPVQEEYQRIKGAVAEAVKTISKPTVTDQEIKDVQEKTLDKAFTDSSKKLTEINMDDIGRDKIRTFSMKLAKDESAALPKTAKHKLDFEATSLTVYGIKITSLSSPEAPRDDIAIAKQTIDKHIQEITTATSESIQSKLDTFSSIYGGLRGKGVDALDRYVLEKLGGMNSTNTSRTVKFVSSTEGVKFKLS